MSSPYLSLKVVDITRETPDAVTIQLEHPQKQKINYKPGQFLTLILPLEGQEVRRSYSISSTPLEGALAVTVKRVEGGLMSNYLVDDLKVGQEVKVMQPMGNFCLTCEPSFSRHVFLFGAGSGITPLMSILKTVLQEEPNSQVTLLYGNRNEESVIFKEQLQELEAGHQGRFHVEYVYSQPKHDCEHRGRMNQTMILKMLERLGVTKNQGMGSKFLKALGLVKQQEAVYYMCGPEGMMEEVRHALEILHVPASRIFKESFVNSKPQGEKKQQAHSSETAAGAGGEVRGQTVTIIYEGAEYAVEVGPDKTILEAALEQNIDLPYSCQAGLCTACRGVCLSGKVELEENDGLSESELEEGYVLNCVAHPLTSDVVIEIR
ncbi:ring-1,2-phenylacetyl-CoA epoxidase subunit PaaE [Pontibacter ummariensis]|uniref:Ring-1,2-phenylacetyl-CoA epoxidase subunit PaaE n=1 Tax=Pontibacter ummariensis TaxID=1610492 RepID=A0A239EX11_9BACT|nr:ferredoxin--NADP reductase [Pontibacter ummariensis]PRY12706.1 ring-1,2-phenylacetyl-CoA epoxidase subunit PaaE [Pontibacter ummariensis]SNS49145.1 ring-1,2-phenylacetyl-CoA epoxidase subunit PaaE [Pontibacter ummariensis]